MYDNVDVQIVNKQEPRKVEMLSEEEKLEKQVERFWIYVADLLQEIHTLISLILVFTSTYSLYVYLTCSLFIIR